MSGQANIFPGRVAVMGGGSWATAQAKMLMCNLDGIVWYMRRQDRIDDFRRLGHNPVYLSDISFDTERIIFTNDINEACRRADTLLLATPSPWFKSHMTKITTDLSGKNIVSAIKGIVPEENETISRYMCRHFGVNPENILVVSGPCHAEEIALGRRSYLTIGCISPEKARTWAQAVSGRNVSAVTSTDIVGIEYASVLKNIYAIAAGIVHGMKGGDNFQAVLVSCAIREMQCFLEYAAPGVMRNICDSVYLGDLLVTGYSRFSRNHNLGAMIGRGYSVRAARMEMEQTAEGFYGSECIHRINAGLNVRMPIADAVYSVLYENVSAEGAMRTLSKLLN